MAEPNRKKTNTQGSSHEPDWVEAMHGYFQQHGIYRAQDLQRVLGDPRDHVVIHPSDEEPINFVSKK